MAIVRLKKGTKRFEVTCYNNKIQDWRSGVEQDLGEVVGLLSVYTSVSKAQLASSKELKDNFGTTDQDWIVREILKKGEIQVGDQERARHFSSLRQQIASQISEKTVDPSSNRPYTTGLIEKAMVEVGFSIKPEKPVKVQVLDCIRLLQASSTLPIQRARMRVRITLPAEDGAKLIGRITSTAEAVEEDDLGEKTWTVTILIDPSQFRVLLDLVQKTDGRARLETLALAATRES
ncbi:Shwachman-Bodian-diamond syndrome protein [Mrakia frigida]|uniref:Shwachman-Bodian-diamond syndrome protein n=1 Tax=Mrakia frigida TaxID=29902 RepID=UPI003FCC0DE5